VSDQRNRLGIKSVEFGNLGSPEFLTLKRPHFDNTPPPKWDIDRDEKNKG